MVKWQRFHLLQLEDDVEAKCLQCELEAGVLQLPVAVARHDDGADHVTELQKRLDQDVVLMVVGDDDVVDVRRKVLIRVP